MKFLKFLPILLLFIFIGCDSSGELAVQISELKENVAALEKSNGQLEANLEVVKSENENYKESNENLLEANRKLNSSVTDFEDKLVATEKSLVAANKNIRSKDYIIANNYLGSKAVIDNEQANVKVAYDQFTIKWTECARTKGEHDAECRAFKENAERLNGRLDIHDNLQNKKYPIERIK